MLKFTDTQKAEVKTVAGKKRKMKKLALSTIAGVTLLGTGAAFANQQLTIESLQKYLSDTQDMVQEYVTRTNGEKEQLTQQITNITSQKEALQTQLDEAIAAKEEAETNYTTELQAKQTLIEKINTLKTMVETTTDEDTPEQVIEKAEAKINALNTKVTELQATIDTLTENGDEKDETIAYLSGLVNQANADGQAHYEAVGEILGQDVEVQSPENGEVAEPEVSEFETALANATELSSGWGTKYLNAEDATYKLLYSSGFKALVKYEAANKAITVWDYKTGEEMYYMDNEQFQNEYGQNLERIAFTNSGVSLYAQESTVAVDSISYSEMIQN